LTSFSRVAGSQTLGLALQAAVGAVASTLVAIASYELFEVHFLRLKKYFPGSADRIPVPTPPLAQPPASD